MLSPGTWWVCGGLCARVRSTRVPRAPLAEEIEISEATGLGRESLCKAFSPGAKPRYDTVVKVLQSFGVKLTVTV